MEKYINTLNLYTENDAIRLRARGFINHINSKILWSTNIKDLELSANEIGKFSKNFSKQIRVPKEVLRLGRIHYTGRLEGHGKNISAKGQLNTDAGNTLLNLTKSDNSIYGHIQTKGVNIGRILNDNHFGIITTDINLHEFIENKKTGIVLNGIVSRFDYNKYSYRHLNINGSFLNDIIKGNFNINDKYIKATANGNLNISAKNPHIDIIAQVDHINPSALKISNQWPNTTFKFNVKANFSGIKIGKANGNFCISKLHQIKSDSDYKLDTLAISTKYKHGMQNLTMNSDFGHINIYGKYDYSTVVQSFINLIGSKLPTLPGLPKIKKINKNDFTIHANITNADWFNHMFNIPLHLYEPLNINGRFCGIGNKTNITIDLPNFAYNEKTYKNFHVNLRTPNDTLYANAYIKTIGDNNTDIDFKAAAAGNKLRSTIKFDNHGIKDFKGSLVSTSQFFKDENGLSTAHVAFYPSDVNFGDTVWTIQPSDIVYRKNHLLIDHFSITHGSQHLNINGLATNKEKDILNIDFEDLDIAYILNMVNFHAVDFGGKVSGQGELKSVFDKPEAKADVTINNFTFEGGRMGTLSANVAWNPKENLISINAIAKDEPNRNTFIKGYVSPNKNYIDLDIEAHNTRGEFLKSFCSSFMSDVDISCNGDIHLVGDMSHDLNLIGKLVEDGNVRITPLNTEYTLRNDTIIGSYRDISFNNDTIYDRNGNIGIVNGHLRHDNLARLKYDIDINAHNLLSYDTHTFGNNTFYGTAYATGICHIKGKSGEINFDIDATPEKGSQIVYNVEGSDAVIGDNNFIHWKTRDIRLDTIQTKQETIPDIPSDMHINFLINCTQDATLKLIMDSQSGDYIMLNGDGVLRASYYNKGAFEMYGNYIVDHGIYKLTIQNAIKKDFNFLQGGTITFGGDPYNAALNLEASYIVNGVSLADLNIGNSFTNNNIRVNCLMDITGTPNQPKVDFNLDMPTVNNDVKQMVFNLINSEEEMSQQVVYLLAVGRFYTQSNNNAQAETSSNGQQTQTSLAMQSLLSGTLSQQINSVLSSVINNNNWNFGANISTGTEGFNNAEYEGLLSGKMFNNRLLFNGQFGYRDNANTTTSFIGDFDLRYLLYPNGNLSINMYNKTNDRYFTRNSLTTQGVGVIMKKDFYNLKDLFGRKRTKKKQAKKR